jgi:hypothetical protein
MEIEESDWQFRRADLAKDERAELSWNVTLDSFSQPLKQYSEMSWTVDGMTMHERDEHISNADFPICKRCEPGRNDAFDRFSQPEKHLSQRHSTVDGM